MREQETEDSFTREEFEAAVRRIQEYIISGDVFQVNLSMRRKRPLRSSGFEIYKQLRQINPSPYMGYIKFGELEIVSSSPELLIKRLSSRLFTRPIAGTRKRGSTPEEDRRLAEELLTNEKENAEHVMLVDLERNDIGKVAKYGSVCVPELRVIEEYSHVMHLVSQVEGLLKEDQTNMDIIKALFPGGTITGAPKVRTVEIIEELEKYRRGIYTGSFGWIDFNGNMEMNIIIRTLLIKNGLGYVQAGAGIVIDSIPEREYKESIRKAVALWQAIHSVAPLVRG
jgi:para-aminobenzoate synthetase component 1